MAITGISALSGQQIIASGACSARSAATASYTTGGNDIQGLYTTVNSNSGNWNTPIFPRDITANSLHIENNGDITLLQQTGDDSDDYAQTVIHGSGIEFIIGQMDPTVIGTIAGNDISNWNSTYNTVSTNSGSWTGGGAGIEYSGIAPIAVNNVSHEISADMSNYVLLSSTATQSLSSSRLSYSTIDLWAYIYSGNKFLYEPFRYYEYRSAGSPAQKGEFSFLIDDKANLTISASAQQEPYIRIGSYSGGSYGYNEINRAAIQKWNNAVDTVSSNSASWTGGGGGVDSATVSAIASSYAESATSGLQPSGEYISANGFIQRITNTANNKFLSFWNEAGGSTATAYPAIYLSGQFGSAHYKDNELKIGRNGHSIAFNIGGQGPKISAAATGNIASFMYVYNTGASATIAQSSFNLSNSTASEDITIAKIQQWNSAYDQLGNVTALLDSL